MKTEDMLEAVGPFTVTLMHGRNCNYLYYGENRIAECINGDYVKRFGGIDGWLKHIKKQDSKRVDKINDQIRELTLERNERGCRISDIHHILTHGER